MLNEALNHSAPHHDARAPFVAAILIAQVPEQQCHIHAATWSFCESNAADLLVSVGHTYQ